MSADKRDLAPPMTEIQQSIVNAMTNHPLSAAVHEQSCSALWRLFTIPRESLRDQLLNAGIAQLLIKGMDSLVKFPEVQVSIIGCFWAISYNSLPNKILLGDLRVICRTLTAMKLYPSNVEVQAKGCGLLMNLSFDHNNCKQIISHKGVAVIAAAVRHHPTCQSIREQAYGAMSNLIYSS